MPLIQRNITAPNERFAMGLSGGTPNQDSINNCIIDIHSALVDSGLTHVPHDGELDLSNIPYLDLPFLAINKTLAGGYFMTLGYKIYAFNDDRQDIDPIYLKFNYGLLNATSGNSNAKDTLLFQIRLDILRNIDSNNKIFDTKYLSNIGYASNADAITYQNSRISVHDDKACVVAYNGNTLYVNIFPKSVAYGNKYGSTEFNNLKKGTYIGFYLEREENVINLYQFSMGQTNSTGMSYIQRNVNIQNYNNNFEPIDTVDCLNIPLLDTLSFPLNNNFDSNGLNPLAFKSITYDKDTKTIKPNYNILCSYNVLIGKSNVKYEIELDDGTIGKYLSHSFTDNNIYFKTIKMDLLFRYE